MKRLLLLLLLLTVGLPIGVRRADAGTTWISPGESRTVGCWSLPMTTTVQRVNFANLRGPGVSYVVTVRKHGWTSGWPWAWWSWTGSYSPLQIGPSTVSASFVTRSGADYHLQLRGLEGVGFASCTVTLSQSSAALGNPANGISRAPEVALESIPDTSSAPLAQPARTSWGGVKARYR